MNITCLLVLGAISLNNSTVNTNKEDISASIQEQFAYISAAYPGISEEEMANKIVDNLNREDSATVKEQISKAFRNLEKYDYVIGSPFEDLVEIKLGDDERTDLFLYKTLDLYLSVVCPEYVPSSPLNGTKRVPDRDSSTFSVDFLNLKAIISEKNLTLNEATSLFAAKEDDGISSKGRFFDGYNFAYLDLILEEFQEKCQHLRNLDDKMPFLIVLNTLICPAQGLVTFGIGRGIKKVISYFDSNFLEQCNRYEVAVVTHYSSIYTQASSVLAIKEKAENKALTYFFDKGKYENDSNNTVDAYRHVYWNALMRVQFGEEGAKAIADAHEYGPIKDGEVNDLDKYRAVDMDLKNNIAGRRIGKMWLTTSAQEQLFKNSKKYPEIPTEEKDALAFYTVRYVCEGFYEPNNIYTFQTDAGFGQTNNTRNNDRIEGLKNSNFSMNKILGDDSYQYFLFVPYC